MGNESNNHSSITDDRLIRTCINDYFDHRMRELSFSTYEVDNHVELSTENISRLCEKLLLLPHEARYVLFGEYCFNMTFEAIHEMFGIDEPHGLSLWYKRLLSNLVGLKKDQMIGDTSMRQICLKALDEYTEKLERDAEFTKERIVPFRKRRSVAKVSKIVAAAAVILVFSVVGTTTVNANFRERIVNWFTETYAKFNLFNTSSEVEPSLDEIRLFIPGYIPVDYTFVETYEIGDGVSFDYVDDDGNELVILITMPSDGWMIDTEGMDVLEMEYGGEAAFYFNNANESRFIFSKGGYPMYIMGNLGIEECIKIADEIKK